MVFDLEKILRAEKEIVRTTAAADRVEKDLVKQRAYKDKLVVNMFQELETLIRRKNREIHSLKEENNSLKNQLGAKDY